MTENDKMPPTVPVPENEDAPVSEIKPAELRALGRELRRTFERYDEDRTLTERRWLQNLRQYLGIYDPEIEKQLSSDRSRAYPRITRVKCVSVLARVMNLMFPGNEKNWTLKASPSPDMSPDDVMEAVQAEMKRMQAEGVEQEMDDEMVDAAVKELAQARAKELSELINDQLHEVGNNQTSDYVALNRKVAQSGVLYGIGVLRGPFVRTKKRTVWVVGEDGQPEPQTLTDFKPQFEFLPVWDYYPDMTSKELHDGDGYFIRLVMSKAQLRKLAKREDFFADVIKQYIGNNQRGNYTPKTFETELRTMGTNQQVDMQGAKSVDGKFEIIVWHGPVSAARLMDAGVDVDDSGRADDIDAEVWMIGDHVIKAEMNPWKKLGVDDIRTVHTFQFDEDDTSPIGNGLPNTVRDSQMAVCSATRMLLDNASITTGPNLEVNTDLMRPDQDLKSVQAYKIWYREGMGPEASQAAIRNIVIDGHMTELMAIIDMFMRMADTETFVGPATGGDMERGYSEPMRTAAGASMLRGDAALPFKDIVRNFDAFTQSAIAALVAFNRKFNPEKTPEGDYHVIPRGATSLIAKEVRGQQVDQLAATLTPEERLHVDDRKLIAARLAVRDMEDMLLSETEVERKRKAQQAAQAEAQQAELDKIKAEIRAELAGAFKDIADGQSALAEADATTVEAAVSAVNAGLEQLDAAQADEQSEQGATGGARAVLATQGGQPGG